MIRVPPLIGFFAKQQILFATLYNNLYFLTFLAIIVSVISASYYLKLVRIIAFSNPSVSNNIINNNRLFNILATNKSNNQNISNTNSWGLDLKQDLLYNYSLLYSEWEYKLLDQNQHERKEYDNKYANIKLNSIDTNINILSKSKSLNLNQSSVKNNVSVSNMLLTNNVHTFIVAVLTLFILFYFIDYNFKLNSFVMDCLFLISWYL